MLYVGNVTFYSKRARSIRNDFNKHSTVFLIPDARYDTDIVIIFTQIVVRVERRRCFFFFSFVCFTSPSDTLIVILF